MNEGWLSFAVKMFVIEHEKNILLDLSNLKVYTPTADYLLAMKVLALRAESFDADDVKFLINDLDLKNLDEVLKIVNDYYPNKTIKPEAKFQIEEIFENLTK